MYLSKKKTKYLDRRQQRLSQNILTW